MANCMVQVPTRWLEKHAKHMCMQPKLPGEECRRRDCSVPIPSGEWFLTLSLASTHLKQRNKHNTRVQRSAHLPSLFSTLAPRLAYPPTCWSSQYQEGSEAHLRQLWGRYANCQRIVLFNFLFIFNLTRDGQSERERK